MKTILIKYINIVLHKFGLSVLILKDANQNNLLLNVFNSTSTKKVLLSYISAAFINDKKINNHHTNFYTSYVFAETLHNLGYAVDVVNWTEKFTGDFIKYDAVIGLGETVEEALLYKNPATKVIFFATGCNPFFSNQVTVKRILDFYTKHKKYLMESSRFVYKDWPLQHQAADWIILHGDTFARSTYRNENISNIKAPVFIKNQVTNKEKDWTSKKNNYLWFGSTGAIHKGLDLLIDAFKHFEDVNLHICGNIESEKRFYEHYKDIIETNKHINYYGYIDIESEMFDSILLKCGFIIFPSASEGNSPSVITCMANGGLIPIVTKSTDVNIADYGIEIKELSINSVTEAINLSKQFTTQEIINQSNKILEYTGKYHSFDYFKQDIKIQLLKILNQ
jgi:glycosyltransferase involved in cell wall biosynthesis